MKSVILHITETYILWKMVKDPQNTVRKTDRGSKEGMNLLYKHIADKLNLSYARTMPK